MALFLVMKCFHQSKAVEMSILVLVLCQFICFSEGFFQVIKEPWEFVGPPVVVNVVVVPVVVPAVVTTVVVNACLEEEEDENADETLMAEEEDG